MCGDFGEETIGLRQRDFWGQRLAQNSFLMAFAFCIVPVSNPSYARSVLILLALFDFLVYI